MSLMASSVCYASVGMACVTNTDCIRQLSVLGNVPHDWLFKHVSCVIHHGGAGTTAAGITAGRPTLIVPFFGDQPFCKCPQAACETSTDYTSCRGRHGRASRCRA
jgi:UDP:flavonoid glycosyltransferase YjiC (YdhE family)